MANVYGALKELSEALKKQYWYCDPMNEGSDVHCRLCGALGKDHIKSRNGYLCPIQPAPGEGRENS